MEACRLREEHWPYRLEIFGRGSAWLERLVRDQEVGGSNPLAPTNLRYSTGLLREQLHIIRDERPSLGPLQKQPQDTDVHVDRFAGQPSFQARPLVRTDVVWPNFPDLLWPKNSLRGFSLSFSNWTLRSET